MVVWIVKTFVLSNLNKCIEPKTYAEACKDLRWVNAMNDEKDALHRNNTSDVVELPIGRKAITCRWIFKI